MGETLAKNLPRASVTLTVFLMLSSVGVNAFGQGQQPKSLPPKTQAKPGQTAGKNTSSPTPRIALGETDGNPGGTAMVAVYFTPDRKNPLRSLTIEIDYVSNSLKFRKASIANAAEQVGATVSAAPEEEAKDEKGLARSKLRLSVSLPDRQAKEGIPNGLLTFLMFDVATTAKRFAIKLTPALISAEDVEGKKVASVVVAPGVVSVQATDLMPEVACFFFTH